MSEEELLNLYYTISTIITALFLLSLFATVGIVLFRLKTTIGGILIAGAYGGFALVILLSLFLGRVLTFTQESALYIFSAIDLIDFVLTIVLAIGIALIPKSLRKLRSQS